MGFMCVDVSGEEEGARKKPQGDGAVPCRGAKRARGFSGIEGRLGSVHKETLLLFLLESERNDCALHTFSAEQEATGLLLLETR